jgi:hypothetical protein
MLILKGLVTPIEILEKPGSEGRFSYSRFDSVTGGELRHNFGPRRVNVCQAR